MATFSSVVQLDILRIEQEQSQWCWAACGAMLYQCLKKRPIEQCTIAGNYFNTLGLKQEACLNPDLFNYGCPPNTISKVYESVGISSKLINGAPKPTLLFNEIARDGRPILGMLQYTNGAGHILIISGVSQAQHSTDTHIYAIDSRKGYSNGWIPYTSLLSGWGQGAWLYSWINIGEL